MEVELNKSICFFYHIHSNVLASVKKQLDAMKTHAEVNNCEGDAGMAGSWGSLSGSRCLCLLDIALFAKKYVVALCS